MVSVGDDGGGVVRSLEDSSTPDSPSGDSIPLNTECFPLYSPGETDGYGDGVYTNKVLYDDTVPVQDDLETQIMYYGDETQVVDDLDVLESTDTQVADELSDRDSVDCDGEASDTTEVLGDDDELSDDESGRGDKVQCYPLDDCEETQVVDQSTDLSHQQPCSASVPRFVSVRTEAFRASPLASRRNSLKHSSNGSCSMQNDSHSSEQLATENSFLKASVCNEIISVSDTGVQNGEENELDNGIKSKVNSSTVRMLFPVGSTTKDGGLCCTGSIAETKEVTESHTTEEDLAGLSYVDSQEPGEASQADALAFVERLIDETKASFETDVNLGNIARRRSDSISTARGTQSLAKKTIDRDIGRGNGIFDWDNRREDEGGGDFFLRRKENLFPGKEPCRSLTNPPNGRSKTRNVCRGNQRSSEVENQMTIHSDSKLVVQKSNVTETERSRTLKDTRKDLLDEFHEHADGNESAEPDETMIPSDFPDVGLDTQLAADAMEALLNGDPIPDFDCDDAKQKHSVQQSPLRKAKRRASSKQCTSNNNHDAETDKRQSKKIKRSDAVPTNQTRKMTRKHSGQVNLECDAHSRLTTKTVERDSDKRSMARGSQTRKFFPSKTSESELDSLNMCNGPALRRRQTVKKQQEIADRPVKARRTRQSCAVSSLKTAENVPIDVDEDKDSTREHPDCEQSPAGTFSGEPAEALNVEGKSSELTSRKSGESDGLRLNLMAAINHISFPRKPRSERRISERPKEHNDSDSHMGNPCGLLRPRKDSIIQPSISASPVGYVTPSIAASPICMTNGLSKKNLATTSLKRGTHSLSTTEPAPTAKVKGSRKRMDLEDIRVLFSHHLDEGVIKRQKKIVDRLKIYTASSIMDATHFVTDRFVRTRNMLEAIAFGKPVVTPLWLEHVGRAKYYIDEQKYIMRDAKKEKEIGFNMAVSLAHARQRPLLQGQKVLITRNAKPSKEILSNLVKAVHGQVRPVEKVGRSAMKDEKLTQELLVLSSEEDYQVCVPFLERGAAVYSSELLLNGIITWNLDYDRSRHRLFMDHVKKS
ncbi:PAX-interacting protein 1 [Linum perenne]